MAVIHPKIKDTVMSTKSDGKINITTRCVLVIFNTLSRASLAKRNIQQKLAIASLLERIRDVGRHDDKKQVFTFQDSQSEAIQVKYPDWQELPGGTWDKHPKAGQVVLDDKDEPVKRWVHTDEGLSVSFPPFAITERERAAVVSVLGDRLMDPSLATDAVHEVLKTARWLGLDDRLEAMAEKMCEEPVAAD